MSPGRYGRPDHAASPPAPASFHTNPVRGPLNAWFFAALDGYLDHLLRPYKQALFTDLPPTVVELGPGVGANLRYLAPGTRLVAVEPNPAMHSRLRARAARAGVEVEVHGAVAERIDLPDACADVVISSLVLCTVAEPDAAVADVLRVLRPGGRYAFVEHVAAPEGSRARRLQQAVGRPWSWTFEGCCLERDLRRVIEGAGFARSDIIDYRLRGPFLPANRQIAGVATKAR